MSCSFHKMLPQLWLLMSTGIALLQLLTMTQPEWIVNGSLVQGLFAICDRGHCVLRYPSALPPLGFHLIGSFLFAAATMSMFPTLLCSERSRPIQIVANAQFLASILMGLCILYIPFDMDEVHCTTSLLLRSSSCRVGWAYAVSSVCVMLSMCCPVLGRLVADERRQYAVMRARDCEYFV